MKITKDGNLVLKNRKEAHSLYIPRIVFDHRDTESGCDICKPNPCYTKDVDEAYKAIEGWLAVKQGKAKERKVGLKDLAEFVEDLDKMISDLRLTLKSVEGCTFYRDPHGQKFPKAYKWVAYSTVVYLTLAKGKYIFDIVREPCASDSRIRCESGLPDQAMKIIKANF